MSDLFFSIINVSAAFRVLLQYDNYLPWRSPRDPTLDVVLDLDGQVLVVDSEAGHWVRFVATRVPVSPEKPHGIDYSLTLHGADGERLVGFDNAHPVGRQKRGEPQDHGHRQRTVMTYKYHDAATPVADFRKVVDAALRERGVIP